MKKVSTMCTPFHAWKVIEDVKNNPSDEMTLTLGDILMSLDKAVLLIGQAFQTTAITEGLMH